MLTGKLTYGEDTLSQCHFVHTNLKNTYLDSNPGKGFSLFIQKQNKLFLDIAVHWDYRGSSGVPFLAIAVHWDYRGSSGVPFLAWENICLVERVQTDPRANPPFRDCRGLFPWG